MIIVLVGNKADLSDKRYVNTFISLKRNSYPKECRTIQSSNARGSDSESKRTGYHVYGDLCESGP